MLLPPSTDGLFREPGKCALPCLRSRGVVRGSLQPGHGGVWQLCLQSSLPAFLCVLQETSILVLGQPIVWRYLPLATTKTFVTKPSYFTNTTEPHTMLHRHKIWYPLLLNRIPEITTLSNIFYTFCTKFSVISDIYLAFHKITVN